jgi:CelD/BcsL family acetyltransferase involved in cellulose biosynthesis
MASRSETRRFYESIAGWAAQRGWLRLALLRVDGVAIAADLALETDDAHYLLKTGFDPAWRTEAPGMLLRQAMIGRAFERGLHRYEFLGHDDAWKREWTTSVHDQVIFQAFAPTPFGMLDLALQRYGRPIARRAAATWRRVVR